MFFGINTEAVEILHDEDVDKALDLGPPNMQRGIIKRIIDYDKNYRLKHHSKSKIERAILALYIFSKESDQRGFRELGDALKKYSSKNGVYANFAKIDASLQNVGGQLYWNP
ncbi:hypothetical protein G3480_20050 [Thiorhodococcus mannitoliphagus]|uniref:Uncharacterized protein n=1 Tax=Thiorhodococcus mannitoliphagus TaxID=329406 RepID=A0A6P1DYL3_9GAMM|nr:hypothetical protein [Thiorhodococcus mannitoliphagus]NEX22570.1 hypothetical protein [Thiorhodococcus mannitoliphagus]